LELGRHGRNRTNVWDYAGVNSFGQDRLDELSMHPTVKPVAMVADALLDCSLRDGIVLDCFGGSGTTLVAAEKTGRRAGLIETRPGLCGCHDPPVRKAYRKRSDSCRERVDVQGAAERAWPWT